MDCSKIHGAQVATTHMDALRMETECKEFRSPDFDLIKSTLKHPVIIDGRNLCDPNLLRLVGVEYVEVGR